MDMNFPNGVAPHDNVLSKPVEPARFLLHAGRLADRIPQVLKAELKLRLEVHLRAQ